MGQNKRGETTGSVVSAVDQTLRGLGRTVVRQNPRWGSVLLHARDMYARSYVRARYLANSIRYTAPPEPYRFIDVDPADVEYVYEIWDPKFRSAGAVLDGEWDLTDDRFEEMDIYRAYERHFGEGVPWQETAFYERIVSELESGTEKWGCRSREEFDERCERLDRLYERIRTEGYHTQDELEDSGSQDPIKEQAPLKTERLKDEIAIHIGRDGQLLFEDGRNRLSIAKVLDLESVPVRVLRRHRQWQAVRDAYVRGHPIPDDLQGHPDLVGLPRGAQG